MRAVAGNLVRMGRPLVQASHYKLLHSKTFDRWQDVTYAWRVVNDPN
jgi:hypothetical protein